MKYDDITEYIIETSIHPAITGLKVIGELIRCKDCDWYKPNPDKTYETGECSLWVGMTHEGGYCDRAWEKKE